MSDAACTEIVGVVVEPDLQLRTALEALVRPGASTPDEDVPSIALLGPGVPVSEIARRNREGGVTLALALDSDGVAAALDAGATDAMLWPATAQELALRADGCANRIATRTDLAIERRDLSALLELSEALSTTRDIEGTLHQIACRMAEVMISERCSIILLGDERERGIVVADSADGTLRNHPIHVAERYPEIVEVVRTGAPLVIDDVSNEPLFDGVREIIRNKPVGSTALFPVTLDGRVQGVMMIRGADVRTSGLTIRQIRFGTIVANATAIALRNARMYQSIRDRTDRMLTARIRAERRLRQLEKYQRFFDLAGDGLTIVDDRGQILFANRAAQQILGFDGDDLTQLRLHDIVQPAGRQAVDELIGSFREGRHRQSLDLPVVRASGEVAILSLSTASLDPEERDPKSTSPRGSWSAVAAIISMRDVTETARMQDELRNTKDFLGNVIHSSADAIVAADIRGSILLFNHVAEKITGYRSEDVVGKMSAAKLYPEGVAQEIMARLRSDAFGEVGKYEGGRYDLVTSDGGHVPIKLAAALVMDEGRPVGSVGIFSDLRDRIRMEQQLASAQQKIELSERQAAVVELAGTVAHELSQPMTSIVGSAELMARRLPDDSPSRSSVDRIISECDRMVDMLKKLGKIAKYETKPYLGDTNILDLDAASTNEEKP